MDKRCIIENCNNNVLAKGFCSKHYKQMYRHGKILSRTIYEKNLDNRNTPKVNSNTGIKGVYRRCDSYYGSINSQGVKYTSKRFNEISEAIAWREMMELYLHGELSPKYIYLLDKYGEINDDQFHSLISYKSNYNMKGR